MLLLDIKLYNLYLDQLSVDMGKYGSRLLQKAGDKIPLGLFNMTKNS